MLFDPIGAAKACAFFSGFYIFVLLSAVKAVAETGVYPFVRAAPDQDTLMDKEVAAALEKAA